MEEDMHGTRHNFSTAGLEYKLILWAIHLNWRGAQNIIPGLSTQSFFPDKSIQIFLMKA